jgi:hypothetical protein
MKKLLILTLLLIVAAFSFSQNVTGTNLDIRNTSKLRGLIYPFGAVATSPIVPAVHEVLMVNNSTFAMCRVDFEEFADSIANHLNPVIGSHWYTVAPDTIKTIYNVLIDSSFVMKYNNYTFGYGDPFGIGQNYLTMLYENGDTSIEIDVTNAGNIAFDPSITNQVTISDTTSDVWISSDLISIGSTSDLNDDDPSSHIYVRPDSINIESDLTKIQGDLTVTGQIKYDYKHLVIYTTGGSYTPNTVSNVAFRLLPTFSTTENDGLTFAGDSITIITPGDYFVQFGVSLQGANGSDWIFKCRKNGVAITTGNLALSTTGAGNYIAGEWFWYLLSLAAGDDICFTVTNEGGSDDPTFRSVKVFIEMKPE